MRAHAPLAQLALLAAAGPHTARAQDSAVAGSVRDVRTPSDQLKLTIDSFRNRRTGYEFAVNPVGVKRDYRNLFGARADNTLLLKASYWFGR